MNTCLLRIESFHFLDALSIILNNLYATPEIDTIYKTQLASICLEPPRKLEKVFVDHDEVDYTLINFGDTIFGMSEQMHCKESFAMLDQYNHCFIDTKENSDSLFYNFALILREKNMTSGLDNNGDEVSKYL